MFWTVSLGAYPKLVQRKDLLGRLLRCFGRTIVSAEKSRHKIVVRANVQQRIRWKCCNVLGETKTVLNHKELFDSLAFKIARSVLIRFISSSENWSPQSKPFGVGFITIAISGFIFGFKFDYKKKRSLYNIHSMPLPMHCRERNCTDHRQVE